MVAGLQKDSELGTTGSKEGFSSDGRAAEKFKFPGSADEKVQDCLRKCVIHNKMEANLLY